MRRNYIPETKTDLEELMACVKIIHKNQSESGPEPVGNATSLQQCKLFLGRSTNVMACVWLGALLLLSTGCQWFKPSGAALIPAPVIFQQSPTQSNLFATVNQRTSNVRQLQAEVSVAVSSVPAKLNGSLIVERPKRLRMKISPLGMDSLGADIGSNDQQFWVWVKSGGITNESMLMFANHSEYSNSQAASVLPIDPQWIFDALGLIEFNNYGNYEGPMVRDDGRLEVKVVESAAANAQISKLIFDAKTGVLVQKAIYDSQGTLVGFCDMTHHQYFPEVTMALPTQIKLTFRPGTKMESVANIGLSNLRINGLYVDEATAWQMPRPAGVRMVDLARTAITPQSLGVQTVGYEATADSDQKSKYLPFRGAFLNLFNGN